MMSEEPASEEEITLFPLVGFATHTLPGALVMLTLELPVDAEAPEGPKTYLRVGLRANGARQLAESLLRAAESAEMGLAPTRTPS
ncbi:hypothetical protein RZS28_12345 [Methylocapsa polymorpha]|uniref:Uncharacterized protein n=1 Tax=Methylocapsa polymorpha TaxID=3080828 RepID=A0ABZ0HRQ1_9HYPH|nr:hypothetical protein RZS28_12345 [Methylocapsa sp. RX1]